MDRFESFDAVLDTTACWSDRVIAMARRSPEEWRAPAAEILAGLEALVDAVRVTDRIDARMHLSRRILMWLADGRPRYLTDIMTRERASASAVQKVAAQLASQGLVQKFRGAGDARYVRVRATERGRAHAEAIREERCALLARHLRTVDPAELDALIAASRTAARMADAMVYPRRTY